MSTHDKLMKNARILSVGFCSGIILLSIQHLRTGLNVYLHYAFGLIIVYLALQTFILAEIVKSRHEDH